MAEPLILTPQESEARIRQLKAEGWEVYADLLDDGTVVVYKRRPGVGGWSIALGLLLVVGLASGARRARRS